MSKKSDFERRIEEMIFSGRRAEALEEVEQMLGHVLQLLGGVESSKFKERVRCKTPDQIRDSLKWRLEQVELLRAQLDKLSPPAPEEQQAEMIIAQETVVPEYDEEVEETDFYRLQIRWKVVLGILACLGAVAIVVFIGKPLYFLALMGVFFFYLMFIMLSSHVNRKIEEDEFVECIETNASASVNMHDTTTFDKAGGWFDRPEPEDD